MRAAPIVLLAALWTSSFSFAYAEDAKFPLEAVTVEGSKVSPEIVMEIAGLETGKPINKASIDAACRKLGESGIFDSASYRYGPGPKGGYLVTLTLVDEHSLVPASIDIPGVDDAEVWRWLSSRFPALDHKMPEPDAAQQFLARQIEAHLNDLHLGDPLRGQHLVARMETNFSGGGSLLSIQPEVLPRIASLSFVGEHEIAADELSGILTKAIGDLGYMDRRFRKLVELNLRPAYEDHGMYRVKFPSITSQPAADPAAVSVTTTIEEGPQYILGDVQLLGDDLPAEAMLKAAHFEKGKIANWTKIEDGLGAMQRPVMRTGYLDASIRPERVFDDQQHVLMLKVAVNKGPLYRFGQVQFLGLSPQLEAKALKIWAMQTGQPYDFAYVSDFIKEFSKATDLRQFKKITPSPRANAFAAHVMDLTLMFEGK